MKVCATLGQGAAMGLSNSFVSLGRIVGPIWAGFIFDFHFNYPYLSGAAILFVGFLIGLVWATQGEKATVSTGHFPAASTAPDQRLMKQTILALDIPPGL